MAIFSFIFGSIVGLASALTGALFFDMPALSAMGLYASTSILIGFALIITSSQITSSAGHEVGV